jgi:L-aspartate oxidase
LGFDEKLGFERFLTRFNTRHTPAYRFDLVVLGGGVAGSLAALTAARRGLEVAVVTKSGLREGNTRYARGGVAAVLSDDDSFASHVGDTLRCGCGLSDRDVVERIVRGGPQAVEYLASIGVEFDRTAVGEWVLSREGGHSFARIIHAQGDSTGLEIQRALTNALLTEPRISSFPDTFAIDLLVDPEGVVAGVLTQTPTDNLVVFGAANVLLATGGAGQIYRETTNPVVATGDGVAMAARAGARLRDLEFVQFHPTCLYIAGAARVLISEIVRGAGGRLVDRDGVAFMQAAHPAGDLAPRDVVSRAVFRRMVETSDTSVYLDLSEVEGDPHAIFPSISRTCRVFGMDIAKDPIPVRPGAHYLVGGIQVDADGRTSLPNLWAVGECASTGLHGANRMGSNSLLEGLVMGMRAGESLLHEVVPVVKNLSFEGSARRWQHTGDSVLDVNIEDLTYSLKSMMWRELGVERNPLGMREAVQKIGFWQRVVQDLAEPSQRSWTLLNMLTLAHLTSLSALAREESRGVHCRADFPDARESFLAHTVLTPVLSARRVESVHVEHVPVDARTQSPIS